MFSSSNKNLSKESHVTPQSNTTQTEPSKLPSLLMTPIFTQNSTWPSYLINPVYNENDTKMDNHYFDTVNNLANNITSYGHTNHVTQNGTQMFPVMPYYVPSAKIGETIPQVMYPPTNTFYNNQNLSIPVVPTSTPTATNDEQRKLQLWYYQYYQPQVHDCVV